MTTWTMPAFMALAADAAIEARQAVTRTVNAAYPALPPLRWEQPHEGHALVGQADSHLSGEVARAAVAAWADTLGLQPNPGCQPGLVEYEGRVDGVRVTVWGVADQGVWERHLRS